MARVIDTDKLLEETLETAKEIAGYSKAAAMVGREAVNQALETDLHDGIHYERRIYYALWATEDAQEGMKAFIEKRDPIFVGR